MIKLQRPPKPSELTDELINGLTCEFKKNSNKRVWNRTYITGTLLRMSYGKCCYCECTLKEESKDLTIDHFHPKNTYPNEVVLWENLLPACSRCNSNKGVHDTVEVPIIDPTCNNPQEHLYFEHLRYKGYDDIGKDTCAFLKLNDLERCVILRCKMVDTLYAQFSSICAIFEGYSKDSSDVRKRNLITNQVGNILKLTSPKHEYSAFYATTILECAEYHNIKRGMKKHDLWDSNFDCMETMAKSVSLQKKKCE